MPSNRPDSITLIYHILSHIGNLPPELITAILYTHGGLLHPNAISLHTLANSFLIRDLANGHAHRRHIVPPPPNPHPVAPHPHLGAAPASPLPPAPILTHHEYETHCICAHSMFALGHPQLRPITTLGQTTLIRHCHRTPPYTRLSFLPYPRSCSLARLLRVMINNLDQPSLSLSQSHNYRDAWRPLASLSATVFGGPTGNNRLLPLTYRDSRDISRRLISQRLGFHPGDPEHSYLWSLRVPRAVLIRTYYKLPDNAPYGGPASIFRHQPAKVQALAVLLQTIDAANTCWAPPTSPKPPSPSSHSESPLPSIFPPI